MTFRITRCRSLECSYPMRRERAHRLACACAYRVPPEPAYAHVDPVGELHDIRGRHVDNALSEGLVSCPHCQHEARRVADKTSARRLTRKNSPSTAPSRAHPRKSSPSEPKNAKIGVFSACWANFFAHRAQRHGDFETNDATAATDAGHRETTITTARP